MADMNSNADAAAGSARGTAYGLPDQVVPLPRQWQRRETQQLPMRGMAGVQQQLFPGAASAADWRPAGAGRSSERAILAGLWLLVALTAVAIGLRFLDLSALTSPQPETAVRPAATGSARAVAYAAVMTSDDPGFDDPLPAVGSAPVPVPVPQPAVPVVVRAGVGLAASTVLAPERLTVPSPARPADACPDALSAMQLCREQRH